VDSRIAVGVVTGMLPHRDRAINLCRPSWLSCMAADRFVRRHAENTHSIGITCKPFGSPLASRASAGGCARLQS